MSGNKKNRKYEVVTETPWRGHPIRRFIITVCILAAVFYVGAFLACGTDGFRSYTEEYLGNHLGIPVHVKHVNATPGLDLVLTGVMTEGISRKGTPGYRVKEAVVRWSLVNKIFSRGEIVSAMELNDFNVSFAPGASGEWEPSALAKLGSWVAEWGRFDLKPPVAAPSSAESEGKQESRPVAKKIRTDFWGRIKLSIDEGTMSWSDADQRELASASGLHFTITPLSVPNRKMTHYFLTVENASVGDRKGVRDFTFEMLKVASNNIVITCVGDWNGTEEGRGSDSLD